jgi:hypothetical protein
MPVEMALWRMNEAGPVPVKFAALDMERRLEEMIAADLTLVGVDLLMIARQVRTDFAGIIDILAVDSEGHLHVLELKRDRTPRDIVAQALDYGSWVQGLSLEQVSAIYANQHDDNFEEGYAEHFNGPIPDVFNADQQLTLIASELDPASERIVSYLSDRYAVPINAVFFRYFADGDAEYLARTWLLPPDEPETARPRTPTAKVRPWNGVDFYVILGTQEEQWRWDVARAYGSLTAGGGSWYWKPLRNLMPGHRVFAYVGGAGYVGIGNVTGSMVRLRDLEVQLDGNTVRVIDQPDFPDDVAERARSDDDEITEYAVPVSWLGTRSTSQAVSERGMFAKQTTVCKLRDERTIDVVSTAFGIES